MNHDSLVGLALAITLLAGVGAGFLANKYIQVKGGFKALLTALTVVVTGFILIGIGAAQHSAFLMCIGIFCFGLEFSWCQNRELDMVCKDGQYNQSEKS
jgi:hypothetical protein